MEMFPGLSTVFPDTVRSGILNRNSRQCVHWTGTLDVLRTKRHLSVTSSSLAWLSPESVNWWCFVESLIMGLEPTGICHF